ncbi:hypothetical protein HXX76_006966 [Chlamydomonas incerta]|uniref:dCTP pyrophosphatase 1 n=1 Tax=Chlamydomonas incerta TaxID=51695 RepID=A0A835TD56_CHLIN|nr:hypothetical protein HXX76_006966 [Chlamydomonas incerta]|eukprot:KAG2435770.1 hypothetical protein HXX76_006966 [Chlamydomonas incerta]
MLALVGEAGELAELFQWRREDEAAPGLPGYSAKDRGAVEEELADVLLYLIRMSDVCGIDLGAAAAAKIAKNAAKYPAERCRGSAAKYHTYQEMRTEARQQKRGREEVAAEGEAGKEDKKEEEQ